MSMEEIEQQLYEEHAAREEKKKTKIPKDYVPMDYHDPWSAMREVQQLITHPPAPTPEECMKIEDLIKEMMEVPYCAKLLKQQGVRGSFFGVRSCLLAIVYTLARTHSPMNEYSTHCCAWCS